MYSAAERDDDRIKRRLERERERLVIIGAQSSKVPSFVGAKIARTLDALDSTLCNKQSISLNARLFRVYAHLSAVKGR